MARSDNLTGALLMMASMACFTLNDTMMKLMAGDVPLFQLLFLRGVFTTAAVAVIAWRMGAFGARVPRRDWWIILWRTVGETGAAYFFLTSAGRGARVRDPGRRRKGRRARPRES